MRRILGCWYLGERVSKLALLDERGDLLWCLRRCWCIYASISSEVSLGLLSTKSELFGFLQASWTGSVISHVLPDLPLKC